jgi:methylmalonyl-CoA epimerase
MTEGVSEWRVIKCCACPRFGRTSIQYGKLVQDNDGLKEGRAMVTKIDHIGIFVENLEGSLKKYIDLLGLEPRKIEALNIDGANDRRAVLPIKDASVELIDSPTGTGFAADFLKKKGEGIHHIAFEVEDLPGTLEELRSRGVRFLKDQISEAPGGRKFVYFQPEEFNGIYIELVQKH